MIRFNTQVEDVVAFNRFHYANSPTMRRQLLWGRLWIPAIMGLFLLHTLSTEGQDPEFVRTAIIAAAAVSLIWFFGLPLYQRWQLLRNVRKLLDEGPRSTLVGWRELDLVGHRLRSRTELVESLMDLRAIVRIASTDRFTFVYISPLNAIIIPMDKFPQDEFADFVQELRTAWERREELAADRPGDPPLGADDRISAR